MSRMPRRPTGHPLTALLAALAPLAAAGCQESPTTPEEITELPRALSVSELAVIRSANAFAFDLLRQVHDAAPDSTVFLSPLSASMALGMTLNGAAGATFEQMRTTLGLGTLATAEINAAYRDLIALLRSLDSRVDLRIANAIFHRQTFQMEAPFLDATRSAFGAEVRGLDFNDPGSAGAINSWVKAATGNRIEEIVEPPIHPLTQAFLINAIYFKGDWRERFDASETRPAPFRTANGASSTVQLMYMEHELPYRNGAGWVAAEIPYGGGAWAMTVAVPTDGAGLDAVIRDAESILDPNARWATTTVQLYLPRFQLEWERLLSDDLKALGMVDAFDDDLADFTPMARTARERGLHIAKVKQKTFIAVDEKGTEAAAVTSVEMRDESAGPMVRADRPFLIAIRERLSGTILFAGLIVQAPKS
jgi:serine protease inhibitor